MPDDELLDLIRKQTQAWSGPSPSPSKARFASAGVTRSARRRRQVLIATSAAAAAALLLATASLVSRAETTLDYDYFKAKVQPIFLTKRATHARCVMCHAGANNMLHLEVLPEGQTAWTEEQTRKNFETVSKIVQAVDDPLQSKILVHPLAPEGGGDVWHSGGRQFANRNDPYWKTIYAWAKGAKLSDGKK